MTKSERERTADDICRWLNRADKVTHGPDLAVLQAEAATFLKRRGEAIVIELMRGARAAQGKSEGTT